jgi:hypothetical protein
MRHSRVRVMGVLGVVSLSVLGCAAESSPGVEQRPLDSVEATATTNQRIDSILTGLATSVEQVDTTESSGIAGDALEGALGANGCDTTSTGTDTGSVDGATEDATSELSDFLTRVRDEAKDHVFRGELVESKDGTVVVYKMDPLQTCEDDTECIQKLTDNPLRFAVTADTDDTFHVSMLVGADRHSPVQLVMSPTKFTITGDLAEAMDSIRLFVAAEDQADLPEKLDGVMELSLEKLGEGQFVLEASVLESLELVTGQAKGKTVTVSVQPTSPGSQIALDSNTNTVRFQENIGTVDVSVAGNAVCEDLDCGAAEQAGSFYLHLAGLSGDFTTTSGATEITFADLGLGAESSSLAVNGKPLVTVDVNQDAGRKFSMNFKKTPEGTLVTFEPSLDLQVALAMTNLSETMKVDMPNWLFDEVFDVTLGGAPKPSVLIPARVCDANGNSTVKDQLKVVTGTLSLWSTSVPSPVAASAGMCLLPVDDSTVLPEDPNPITLLRSGVCQ